MTEGSSGTQGRRATRTRAALVRGAREVFEQQGFHDTRIVDITKAAGVAVGSFYTHFDSKREIFRDVLLELEDEVYGELQTRRRDLESPADLIRETNHLYLDSFRRNAGFWAMLEEATLSDEASRAVRTERLRSSEKRTERAIRSWQSRGLIPPDVDPASSAQMLGAMTERCAYLWYVFDEPPDIGRDEAAESLTQLWVDALQLRHNTRRGNPRKSDRNAGNSARSVG